MGRPDDKPVGHSEAVVHILNCITSNGWQGQFENKLFLTLSVSIVRDTTPITPARTWSHANKE